MKSAYWLNQANEKLGNLSDKELAIKIGISAPTISQHRSGICKTLKDDHCMVIAEICGIDPAIVIADQQAERASPAVRSIYERMGKLVAGGAVAGVSALLLLTICQLDTSGNVLTNMGFPVSESLSYGTFTLVILLVSLSVLFAKIPKANYVEYVAH